MNLLEPGRFVWPVLGIERYQAVAIPESVHTVVIYSQHGAEAARAIERATPHLAANGPQLVVKPPPHAGDWNDLLREIRSLKSEERRVGQEGVRTCISRGVP